MKWTIVIAGLAILSFLRAPAVVAADHAAVQLVSIQLYQYWSPDHIRYYGYEIAPTAADKGFIALQTCDQQVIPHLKPTDLQKTADNCGSVLPHGLLGKVMISTKQHQGGGVFMRVLDADDNGLIGQQMVVDSAKFGSALSLTSDQATKFDSNKVKFWAAGPSQFHALTGH